jgi:hypothetical protein
MARRRGVVAALLLLTTLLVGCAQPNEQANDTSAPGQGAAGTDNPADAEGKAARPGADPATERDQFMPTLRRAYGRVTWSPTYTMGIDEVWSFMAAGAADTAYTEVDATSMVTIWNACAWTLQLIDDTKAGRPVDQAVASLTALKSDDLRSVLGKIISDAKLGDIATARQFVTANDCAAGFK